MNLDEIKELIAVMRKNKIKEVDLEQKGVKMRLVAMDEPRPESPAPTYIAAPQQIQMIPQQQIAAAPAVLTAPAQAAAPQPAAEPEISGVEVKSPMVGTFYRSPSPDAPAYTEVGAVVNTDSVLCIIEAMKLMNEIKSEVRGKILKILVESGQPVEFNQPLFIVEPF
ncbi:TPA: acetyl-CoA carboxylase biotin carboxyl carrier protein [Candidatus Sumerlaeota bacterium]|nr:acetyl-CoA carboxylase biotin carboxyl carrier protein [Candidatus Sumerlaeota bacterium]